MKRIHIVLLVLVVGGLTRNVPLAPARAEANRSGETTPARTVRPSPLPPLDGARPMTGKGDSIAAKAARKAAVAAEDRT